MTRLAFVLLAFFIPKALWAENILVRSGEHPGFSRLVLRFDVPVEWTIGRVASGYEFRSTAHSAEFDLTKVFARIPRTRISKLEQPGPGRLTIQLACDCQINAFELADGRLVLDVTDTQFEETQKFNAELPLLEDGAIWVPIEDEPVTSIKTPQPTIFAQRFDMESEIQNFRIWNTIQTEAQPLYDDMTYGDSIERISTGEVARNSSPDSDIARNNSTGRQSNSPSHISRKPDEFSAASSLNINLMNSARTGQQLPELLPDQVVLAKRELVAQLGKAAAQGLISLELTPQTFRDQDKPQQPVTPSPSTAQYQPPVLEDSEPQRSHIRIETAVDKNQLLQSMADPEPREPQNCLPSKLFDISAWGPENVSGDLYGNLRATTILEFDKPDPGAIATLAKRYLFLGFGAEAASILQAFEVEIPDSAIFYQLSDILDYGFSDLSGPLTTQLGCAGDAALWAALMLEQFPKSTDLNTKAILSTFSALPAHLRSRVGPWLAERFAAIGDLSSAKTVRNVTDRSAGKRNSRFALMDARLTAQNGDEKIALQLLKEIANSEGPAAAQAVVELIETALKRGQPVDQSYATLADAMSVENRGTDIGRRLTNAAIRGFAGSGQVETTFERILSARETGDISALEAVNLQVEAHLRNAQLSSDAIFLNLLYRYKFPTEQPSSQLLETIQLIAARLNILGLPEKTRELYVSLGSPSEERDKFLLAQALFLLGDYQQVVTLLTQENDPTSLLLKARANELMQDLRMSGEIYSQLSMNKELASVAWRNADWQTVASGGSNKHAQLAELILRTSNAATLGESAIGTATSEGISLNSGRNLISKSLTTRQTITALLTEQ